MKGAAKAYQKRTNTAKNTSIGRNAKPTNKHKRRSHKAYRGQGHA